MEIKSVFDPAFVPYGRVWTDMPQHLIDAYVKALNEMIELPDHGRVYHASEACLENLPEASELKQLLFGGLPCELGRVAGRNTRLDALEYHRSSEFNLPATDAIFMLAPRANINHGKLDASCIQPFFVPAGTLVEFYATSMHLAPCHTDPNKGFKVLVVLPKGTNEPLTDDLKKLKESGQADAPMLCGINKWLMAHPDSPQARSGAYVGLTGANIDLAGML